MSDSPEHPSDALDRRTFLAGAAAAVAALGLPPGAHAATDELALGAGPATGVPAAGAMQARLPALGNGEMISTNFAAYPGGTGALLERMIRERGVAAFQRNIPAPLPLGAATLPATDEEIAFLPVHRLSAFIHAGKLTSARLTDIYLARLREYNPKLLCAVTVLEDRARREAAERDAELRAGRSRGPLHGIPYGIKDLFAVRGTPTTWGCLEFESRVIDDDAEVYTRLHEAGAVLIAKLATGLFAQGDQWFRGRTNNPWNLAVGSSGSSAGPASATAAGCVAFGIGTETQGSIVSPSIRCGLSALRPTFGRTSRHGGMFLSWTQDKVGPICRCAEDAAIVFAVFHGSDEKDPSTITMPFVFARDIDLSRLRIGYDETAPEEFVARLRSQGAAPTPIGERPRQNASQLNSESASAFDFMVAPHLADGTLNFPAVAKDPVVRAREAAAAPEAGRGGRGTGGRGGRGGAPPVGGDPPGADTLGALRSRFTSGRGNLAIDFVQAERERLRVMHDMATLMRDFDLYVSGSGDVGLLNQTGHPAVVLPYRFGVPTGRGGQPQPDGKLQPICVTLVGQLFADDTILSVAHAFQKATDFHLRRPTIT